MNDPQSQTLLRAFADALRPHVESLRRDGWPVEVVVESAPVPRVFLVYKLPALKVPLQVDEP